MSEESTEGFFNKPPQEKITPASTQPKKPIALSLRDFLRSLIGSRQRPEVASSNQESESNPVPPATSDKTQPSSVPPKENMPPNLAT